MNFETYDPPFFVLNDEAYNRMMTQLHNGERYIKSYLHTCPHKKVEECKCKFYLNFLQNGEMVRIVNGQTKKVYSLSMVNK